MIWEGVPRAEAAAKAGLADSSLRFALRKPHVLAHHNAKLAALRTSLRARNAHRLNTIAQESPNHMASVSAIKTLESLAEAPEQHLASPRQTPASPSSSTLQPSRRSRYATDPHRSAGCRRPRTANAECQASRVHRAAPEPRCQTPASNQNAPVSPASSATASYRHRAHHQM